MRQISENRPRFFLAISIAMVALFCSIGNFASAHEETPKTPGAFVVQLYEMSGGIVRDNITAIAIAKAIMTGLYGEEFVADQEQWTARVEANNWIVKGSPHDKHLQAAISISRFTGRVFEINVPTTMENPIKFRN